MAFRSLAADDIFISYTRLDASTYAAGLADELTKRGFSCFIDRLGTVPDKDLPDMLRRKIKSCAMLVIVGTERAGTRQTIYDEVREFLQTGRGASIVPVDFDGAVYRASWYPLIEGVAPEPEKNPAALDDGEPSPSVLSRIEKQFNYARRNQRLRRAALGTAVLLALLLLASVGAGVYASRQLQKAKEASERAAAESARADGERDKAEKAAREAREALSRAEAARAEALTARGEAEAAQADARTQKRLAERAAQDAEAKTKLAAEAAHKAAEAAARAAAQQARADRERVIADARALANRSQALLRRRPEALPHAVSYAAEAVRKASDIEVYSVEADSALREALAMLPRFESAATYDDDIKNAALSPDARHLATTNVQKTLRVYETGSQTLLYELPGDGHLVALSNDAARAAVAGPKSVIIYDLRAGTSRLLDFRGVNIGATGEDVKDEHLQLKGVALSPGGRYLAVIQSNQMRPYSDGLSVWDVEAGREVARLTEQVSMVVNDAAFSPRGNFAAGGWANGPEQRWVGKVYVWPLRDRYVTDCGKDGELTAGSFKSVVSAYQEEEVRSVAPGLYRNRFAADGVIWQTTGAEYVPVARMLRGEKARDMAFTCDGQELLIVKGLPTTPRLAAGGYPVRVERWQAGGYAEEALMTGLEDVTKVGFTPGSGEVAVADTRGGRGVRLFRVPGGAELPAGAAQGAAGEQAQPAAADETDEADEADGREAEKLIHVSRDARFSVTRRGAVVRVRDAWRSQTVEVSAAADLREVSAAALDEDGAYLALAGAAAGETQTPNGVALVYKRDGDSYKEPRRLRLAGVPYGLELSAGGSHLLARARGAQSVSETASGSDVTPPGLGRIDHAEGATQFSPGGQYLAAVAVTREPRGGAETYAFRVWRLSDREEVMPPVAAERDGLFAFSPRGRFLLMSGVGAIHVTRLLELETGRVSDVLYDERVTAAAFSADERYVAVGDEEGSVRLYQRDDLENEIALLPHLGKVTAVSFSADGKYLVTASGLFDPFSVVDEQNKQVRVWLLRPADLLAEARRRLERMPDYAR